MNRIEELLERAASTRNVVTRPSTKSCWVLPPARRSSRASPTHSEVGDRTALLSCLTCQDGDGAWPVLTPSLGRACTVD